jgi:ribose 5-phosphate isomerase B
VNDREEEFMMTIAIGSDHRGVDLKRSLVEYLKKRGYEVTDVGTFGSESCDYPEYCAKVGRMVAANKARFGVFICYTGVGSSIALNKVAGVRASLVHNVKGARFTRLHNDSNVLVLGSAFVNADLAKRILSTYLKTEFEGGRHMRRVEQINKIEKGLL